MKTDKNFPIGLFKGKVGNYVFYIRKGKQCARRLPNFQHPPCSPAQVAQQERLASAAVFYRAVKDAGLYGFWQKAAEHTPQTGYNLLTRSNMPVFDNEGRISDFSKLRLTPNLIPLPANLTPEASGEGEWTLTWQTDSWRKKSRKDDLLMVALMKDEKTYTIKIVPVDKAERGECRAVVRIPEACREYAHLFCWFRSQKTGESSAAEHFNLLTLKNVAYGNNKNIFHCQPDSEFSRQ